MDAGGHSIGSSKKHIWKTPHAELYAKSTRGKKILKLIPMHDNRPLTENHAMKRFSVRR